MTDLALEHETQAPERDELTADIFGEATPAPAPTLDQAESPAAYTVIARKYRPRNFDDLIGQEGMVRTLKNAFSSGRIAHAFMLTGVRGVGKTTTARLLARALNYESETVHQPSVVDLAVEGRHCRAIIEGRHLDVLELDAASRNGVGEMRELLDSVRYGPAEARNKIYIIDEVHMLSTAAFNALLKTLEEPPPHAKFIFATTEIRKVPVTILSRCQRFDLRRVEPAVIGANLAAIAKAEGFMVEDEALTLIARAAEGSVRDAQSLLDQALVQADPGEPVSAVQVQGMLGLADVHQSIAIFEYVAKGDAAGAIAGFRALHAVGADPATVALDLLEHAHGASLARTLGVGALVLPKDQAARLEALGSAMPASALSRLWQMLLRGHEETRSAPNPASAVEMLLIRLAYAADLPGPEEALKLLREGSPIPSGAPMVPSRAPSGGSGARAALAPAVALPASTPVAANAPPSPQSFEEVVALAGERRDIALKLDLEKYVRLVSFRPGAIEFEPAPGAPANLSHRLVSRLKDWTGETWLAVPKAGGAETLVERQTTARRTELAEAVADPFVQTLLAAFPGAEVVDVRQVVVAPTSAEEGETDPQED